MKKRQLLYPELVKAGDVLFHSGRGHHYMVYHETDVKTESGWKPGLAYSRVYLFQGRWIPHPTSRKVYTRPLSLFDKDDWSILVEE